jgi:hypothetical protein
MRTVQEMIDVHQVGEHSKKCEGEKRLETAKAEAQVKQA